MTEDLLRRIDPDDDLLGMMVLRGSAARKTDPDFYATVKAHLTVLSERGLLRDKDEPTIEQIREWAVERRQITRGDNTYATAQTTCSDLLAYLAPKPAAPTYRPGDWVVVDGDMRASLVLYVSGAELTVPSHSREAAPATVRSDRVRPASDAEKAIARGETP